MSRTPRLRAIAATLTLGALLTACGSSVGESNDSAAASEPGAVADPSGEDTTAAQTDSTTADAATAADPGAAVPGAPAAATGGAVASGTKPGKAVPKDIAAGAGKNSAKNTSIPDAALTDRDVIYTADMTVQVADVPKAVSQIESAVRAAGGLVAGSERSTDAVAPVSGDDPAPAPRSSAQLVLRIPPGDFGSVLDRIGALGVVLDRNLTGKDVTEAVIDVKSRIASARTSVVRIRDLMDRAVTLRDVVALEGELSQREADLESLLAKQAKLKDQTSLATLTVRLVNPEQSALTAAEDDEKGFTAGLSNGWNAFTDGAVVAATVLGALLPFAVALLLLGPPLAWLAARLRRSVLTARPRGDALG